MPVELIGKDKLVKKLNKLANAKGAKRALHLGGVHISGTISKYPPSSDANVSSGPGSTWYERGYGTKYQRVGGGVSGRKTSETLGKRWTVVTRNSGWTVIIGNNASYAPFVQSFDDQARFHGARGWLTDYQVMRQQRGKVMALVMEAIRKDLR